MLRTSSLAVIAASALVVQLFGGAVAASAATEITIPDAELRACINDELGQPADAPITQDQADGVTTVYCGSPWPGENSPPFVADLTGIEAFQNLDHLEIYESDISSITPVESLANLTVLAVRDARITDIAPLANLTHLTYLDLGGNSISDLSPVAGLTALDTLDIDRNQVVDISSVANLTGLEDLNLSNNQISEIAPINGLASLRTLYLSDNQVADVSVLTNVPMLQWLYLDDNQISVLELSEGLRFLEILTLSGNQIKNVEPLKDITALRSLELNRNEISDVTPLVGLTELRSLRLNNNHISDLSALGPLVLGPLIILDVAEQTIQLPQTTVGQREMLAPISVYDEHAIPESTTASVNPQDGSWVLPTAGEHRLTWNTGMILNEEPPWPLPPEELFSDGFSGTIIQTAEEIPAASGLAVVGPKDVSVAEGDTAVFTSSASSDSGNNAPRWEHSTDGGVTWAEVPGPWTDTLRVENSSSTLTGNMFRVEYTNDSDGAVVVSDPARLTVVAKTPPQPKPPVDLPASPGGELAASGAQHAAPVWAGVLAAMLLGVFLIGNSVRRSRALPREQ